MHVSLLKRCSYGKINVLSIQTKVHQNHQNERMFVLAKVRCYTCMCNTLFTHTDYALCFVPVLIYTKQQISQNFETFFTFRFCFICLDKQLKY